MATVIVMIGYGSVLPTVQEFMGNIRLLEWAEVVKIVILAFFVMGIGIGMAGSAMSIRKHLHV